MTAGPSTDRQLVSHRWAGECAWTVCCPRAARLREVFGARAVDSLRAAAAARCWLRFRWFISN
ncbi:hypothetical protein K1T71_008526 [Dendrolimus kikuchii]|uniref:Uncharacterized protein n=1 Tax=Dendrolimus kikuchii TaxID=765133 RepID=A0ACC1CUW2_9NEOP|nr:hypothetical protein K1T71_008526 [Dendrolimus kikuchii]